MNCFAEEVVRPPMDMPELWQYDVICDDFNFDQAIDRVLGQEQDETFKGGYHFDQDLHDVFDNQESKSLECSPSLECPELDDLLVKEAQEVCSVPKAMLATSEPTVIVQSKIKSSSAKRRMVRQPEPQPSAVVSQPLLQAKPIEEAPKCPLQKPKRSLSAYNFFFHDERMKLKSSGRIGFAKLARTIATKWKTIEQDIKMEYEYKAAVDLERYEKEFAAWKAAMKKAGLSTSNRRTKKKVAS
mmetsp:Transcript_5824/g.12273  ORF Transcript_5824/g.12273 Transcript_5824/m.12273 type:complete len:242 (-) Transcript_5824:156-881(-)